jgi:hypothetical protein
MICYLLKYKLLFCFSPSGLIQFVALVKEMLKDDPEIERLYRELQKKSYLDPHF